MSVTVSPDSEVTAAALLQHQASLYAVWPAVEQGLLGSGSMEGSSCTQMTPELGNKAFSGKSTQYIQSKHGKQPYKTVFET